MVTRDVNKTFVKKKIFLPKNRKNPSPKIKTLSKTEYYLWLVVCGYFALIFFYIEPFYQGYHRFRLGFLMIFWVCRVPPSQIFRFKLPHLYHKRIFAKGRSLGTLIIQYRSICSIWLFHVFNYEHIQQLVDFHSCIWTLWGKLSDIFKLNAIIYIRCEQCHRIGRTKKKMKR